MLASRQPSSPELPNGRRIVDQADAPTLDGVASAAGAPAFSPIAPPSAPPPAAAPISMASSDAFAASASAFAVKASADGTSQAVLRVSPEALGPMTAEISMSKRPDGSSSITMTLTMANSAAMDVAKQGLDKLQSSLEAAGLPQAQVNLKFDAPVAASAQSSFSHASLQSGQGGQSQHQQQPHRGPSQGRFGADAADEQPPASQGWRAANLFDQSA